MKARKALRSVISLHERLIGAMNDALKAIKKDDLSLAGIEEAQDQAALIADLCAQAAGLNQEISEQILLAKAKKILENPQGKVLMLQEPFKDSTFALKLIKTVTKPNGGTHSVFICRYRTPAQNIVVACPVENTFTLSKLRRLIERIPGMGQELYMMDGCSSGFTDCVVIAGHPVSRWKEVMQQLEGIVNAS